MSTFAYYNKKGRLIRVNEATLNHFRDITPYSNNPLSQQTLKASYNKWLNNDENDDEWELIATLDSDTDSDRFMQIYNSFSGVTDYKKPRKKNRTIMTPELISAIKKRLDKGNSPYSVAKFFGVSRTTILAYSTMT